MIKYFVAAAALVLLVAGCSPSGKDVAPRTVSAPAENASHAIVKAKFSTSEAGEIPAEINIPSAVGEVVFHHEMHIKDFSIKCVECHHQIDAKKLNTPHPEYLKSSSVNCQTCHSEGEKAKQKLYTCSECHHTNPGNIADETLSAKVVIHKKCWNCHEVGTGKEASSGCEKCHSGKKML